MDKCAHLIANHCPKCKTPERCYERQIAHLTDLLRRWATKPDSDDGVALLRETLSVLGLDKEKG